MDLMWNTESSRKAVLAEGRYVEAENGHCGRQKLSSGMAMVLGALLTMEIMLGGAMLFNFDFRGADLIAQLSAGVTHLYQGAQAVNTGTKNVSAGLQSLEDGTVEAFQIGRAHV